MKMFTDITLECFAYNPIFIENGIMRLCINVTAVTVACQCQFTTFIGAVIDMLISMCQSEFTLSYMPATTQAANNHMHDC